MFKTFLCGRLTRDAEPRSTKTGEFVCNFTVAAHRRLPRYNVEDDSKYVEYVRCNIWGEYAKNKVQYLTKGKMVTLVGEPRINEYIGKDGKSKACFELRVDDIEFGAKPVPGNDFAEGSEETVPANGQPAPSQAPQGRPAQPQSNYPAGFVEVDENELPF